MLKLRMNSIIQQQTNDSNSNYCKMPDGTLIQWGLESVTPTLTGGVFTYSGGKQITFSIPYIQTPIGVTCPVENGGYWNTGATTISTTQFSLWIAGNNQTAHDAAWIAIGRWK